MLTGNLPPLQIKSIAIGVVGGLAKATGYLPDLVYIAKLFVSDNVTEHQILAHAVPGRAFAPPQARVQPFDGSIDERLGKTIIKLVQVRLRITDRRRRRTIARTVLDSSPRNSEGGRYTDRCAQKFPA